MGELLALSRDLRRVGLNIVYVIRPEIRPLLVQKYIKNYGMQLDAANCYFVQPCLRQSKLRSTKLAKTPSRRASQ